MNKTSPPRTYPTLSSNNTMTPRNYPTNPSPHSGPGPKVTNIPVQLSSPSLILKAKESSKDDIFPRKKKSE